MHKKRALPQKAGYHHGDLRRALVAAATQLVAEGGEAAFTLREAAARVGVSHVAAYRHFSDKTELFAAVAEEGFVRLATAQRQAVEGHVPGSTARLTALALAYVRFALDEAPTYRVMFGDRLDEGPVPGTHEASAARAAARFPTLDAAVEVTFGILLAEVTAAQAAGNVVAAPARDLALALWTLTHGYVDLLQKRRIRGSERARVEQHYLKILGYSLRGIKG